MKAGVGNPQARQEEGKLSLLGTERSSSLVGIPGIWGLEFHGKAATFIWPFWKKRISGIIPWIGEHFYVLLLFIFVDRRK